MAVSSHPVFNALTLMVTIRKITTGPDTATEIDSAQAPPYPSPNATKKKEKARLILDGSKIASKTGTMFECCPGSAKIAVTHTSSGRTTDRTVSNEITKEQPLWILKELLK
jgi:hypothetical protein